MGKHNSCTYRREDAGNVDGKVGGGCGGEEAVLEAQIKVPYEYVDFFADMDGRLSAHVRHRVRVQQSHVTSAAAPVAEPMEDLVVEEEAETRQPLNTQKLVHFSRMERVHVVHMRIAKYKDAPTFCVCSSKVVVQPFS